MGLLLCRLFSGKFMIDNLYLAIGDLYYYITLLRGVSF
jgi:hypothetical protein